jgi:hypothetical protein
MNHLLAARVTGWALPVVAGVFFVLYVMHLVGGAEAETALVRAGAVGVALALLARLAAWVLDAAERPIVRASASEGTAADTVDLDSNLS